MKWIGSFLLVVSGWFLANSMLPVASLPNELQNQAEPVVARATTADRVASFVIRAVADIGLMDTTKILLDYQGVTPLVQGWEVDFTSYDCHKNLDVGRCIPYGEVAIGVLESDGILTIVEIRDSTGSLPLQELISHAGMGIQTGPHFEFPSVQLVRYPDVWALEGSALWTGPIPADPGYVALCHGEVLDHSGQVIGSGSLSLTPPLKEELRSGGIVPIDIPELSAAGEEFIVHCDTSVSQGWQPEGTIALNPAHDSSTNVAVTATLAWSGPDSIEIRTLCVAYVFDSDGKLAGSGQIDLVGPVALENGTSHQVQVFIPTSASYDRSDDARVECVPLHQSDPRVGG